MGGECGIERIAKEAMLLIGRGGVYCCASVHLYSEILHYYWGFERILCVLSRTIL